jgi:hypothetical protein
LEIIICYYNQLKSGGSAVGIVTGNGLDENDVGIGGPLLLRIFFLLVVIIEPGTQKLF